MQIKGIKQHVIVDTNGFLIAVMVTMTNIHNSQATVLLMRVLNGFLSNIQIILPDEGYRGELIDQIKRSLAISLKLVSEKTTQIKLFSV